MYCPRFPIPSPSRARSLAGWSGIALAALSCAGFFAAILLAQATPTWWHSVNRDDPAIKRVANTLQNDLMSEASRIRPAPPGTSASEPWELTVTAADANAWLNTQLPKWLANQSEAFNWPAEITQIQVYFEADQVYLGVQLRSGGSTQILTAAILPSLKDGCLFAPAQSISLGRLPVPRSWFLSPDPVAVAEERIPKPLRELPQTRELAAAFAGHIPVLRTPVVKLGDGRRVRLLSLSPNDGKIRITCCTELR